MSSYCAADDFGSLMQAINHCTLEMQRAGREASLDRFPIIALKLLNEVIAFDSAWWGIAVADSSSIYQDYLHNCDDSILDDYLPYAGSNFFRKAMGAQPSVTINLADLIEREEFVKSRIYREFCQRHKQECLLGTLLIEPVSQLCEKLIIWRHDSDKPFNESERRAKQLIMSHLEDAHRFSRLRNVFGWMPKRYMDWAVTDAHGYLREISPGFVHFMRTHCPDWTGRRVPQVILDHIAGLRVDKRFSRIQASQRGDFFFLQLEPVTALDGLSKREMEIATRYAKGNTYNEIASALVISPATVRNHISKCYRKLSVNNKAELLARLYALKEGVRTF